jgi:SAM-dependent methyltransferase
VATMFLHIPKTAGGTLKQALQIAVSQAGKTIQFANGVKAARQIELTKPDFIFGHLGYGIHEILGIDANYITFLRHPVNRVISHYYQLFNVDKSIIGDMIRNSADINSFFREQKHWEFDNLLCRVCSGKMNKVDDVDKAYHLALDNVRKDFIFIGFQEHFDLSLACLSRTLGFRILPNKEVNVGQYQLAGITDETIDRIVESNQHDIAFYKELIATHLPSSPISNASDINRINSKHSPPHTFNSNVNKCDTIEISPKTKSIPFLRLARFKQYMYRLPRDASYQIMKSANYLKQIRSIFAMQYLSGQGLEIGPGRLALPMPPDTKVEYLNDISAEELAKIKNVPVEQIKVNHIGTAERLPFKDEIFDFVASCHVLEHLEDPIRGFCEQLRVVKPAGVILMALPNYVANEWDFKRTPPTISHLQQEHADARIMTMNRLRHYRECVHAAFISKGETGFEETVARLAGQNKKIHFHVFNRTLIEGMVAAAATEQNCGCELLDAFYLPYGYEIICVIRKILQQPVAVDIGNFAEKSRTILDDLVNANE